MTAYRDEDAVDRMQATVARIEERVAALESSETKASWLAWFADNYPPVFVLVFAIACVIGSATIVRGCAEDARTAVHQQSSDCANLCSSMGLRGGVVIRWTNGESGGAYREGGSCVCGNGMGGAIRVDPDGRQVMQLQTAAAPDGGAS